MKRTRSKYVVLISLIIFLGVVSRSISIIPLFVGDVLWATMVFFITRFLLIYYNISLIALISLLVCYLVEMSQLYQENWINNIRQTILGRLILGQGFLWSDVLAYAIGVLIGALIEIVIAKNLGSLEGSKGQLGR